MIISSTDYRPIDHFQNRDICRRIESNSNTEIFWPKNSALGAPEPSSSRDTPSPYSAATPSLHAECTRGQQASSGAARPYSPRTRRTPPESGSISSRCSDARTLSRFWSGQQVFCRPICPHSARSADGCYGSRIRCTWNSQRADCTWTESGPEDPGTASAAPADGPLVRRPWPSIGNSTPLQHSYTFWRLPRHSPFSLSCWRCDCVLCYFSLPGRSGLSCPCCRRLLRIVVPTGHWSRSRLCVACG